MTSTREYPTERLIAERDAGLLVCHCADPYPVELVVWALPSPTETLPRFLCMVGSQ